MHFFTFLSAFLVAAATASPIVDKSQTLNKRSNEPFRFPLPNGFPNVNATALKAIEKQAGGPLPTLSGAGGSRLSQISANALSLVTFNELFEVAFFTELLHNVTNNVPGFELDDNRETIIGAIMSSQAQEELHTLNANDGLNLSKYPVVQPCAYNFPVNNFTDAMSFADNFSSLLVGGIGYLVEQFILGGNGDDTTITLFSSVIGQEGQQEGFFRFEQSKVPNANAFLTSTTLSFIYNHILQNYIAQGSCPPSQTFDVQVYEVLTPLDPGAMTNTTVRYSTTQKGVDSTKNNIVYMSGEAAPFVIPISNLTIQSDGLTTFSAAFPYDAGFSRGLTVAALVNGTGPFMNNSQVAEATLAGPGLFQLE